MEDTALAAAAAAAAAAIGVDVVSLDEMLFVVVDEELLSAVAEACFDCGPVTSARPRTCNSWAVFRKSLICSCPICTSPLYINRSKLSTSSARTSRKMTIGCSHGLAFSSFRKYGLQALSTTLCAVKDRVSQASVTSTKSSSSRKCRNDDRIELWKSFHFSEYCCSDGDGETGGSIFTPVVLLFSVVWINVDSVISLAQAHLCWPAAYLPYLHGCVRLSCTHDLREISSSTNGACVH